MIKTQIFFSVLVTLLLLLNGCSTGKDFPVLKGPYLGQELPGMTAEIFAPGIISTCFNEHGISFSPDGKELYYRILGPPRGAIYYMKERQNGNWTKPMIAPFLEKYDAKIIEDLKPEELK